MQIGQLLRRCYQAVASRNSRRARGRRRTPFNETALPLNLIKRDAPILVVFRILSCFRGAALNFRSPCGFNFFLDFIKARQQLRGKLCAVVRLKSQRVFEDFARIRRHGNIVGREGDRFNTDRGRTACLGAREASQRRMSSPCERTHCVTEPRNMTDRGAASKRTEGNIGCVVRIRFRIAHALSRLPRQPGR